MNVSAQAERMLIEDVSKFEKKPLSFVKYAFPWGTGHLQNSSIQPWQSKILSDVEKHLTKNEFDPALFAVASGHGVGKSALVSWLSLWALSTRENTRGIITANTETQLKTKTWAEISKWYNACICKHWFEMTATSIFSTSSGADKTWRIDQVPWSKEKTESFAGMHNKGNRIIVFFDEAAAIPDQIFEVTEGALTDKNTQILWFVFGNPTRNVGRFRECFRKYRHRWHQYNIDSRDVEITNKEQISKWVDDYGIDSDFVKVRVRGMFPEVSDRQFISQDCVDAASNRSPRRDQYCFAPTIIGVDPAWTGGDKTVAYVRQGVFSKRLFSLPKNDDDLAVAGMIAKAEDEYNADAVFIDLGYGTGIYSAGKNLGRSWNLVAFGSKSSNPGYANKRTEMWANMRDWLKNGGAIQREQTLMDDLIAPEIIPDKGTGVIQLESKEIMKQRGIPSPNDADALALTFAFAVRKKSDDQNFSSTPLQTNIKSVRYFRKRRHGNGF